MGKDTTDSAGAGFENGRAGEERDRTIHRALFEPPPCDSRRRRALTLAAVCKGWRGTVGLARLRVNRGIRVGESGIKPAPHRGCASASRLELFCSAKALAAPMTVACNEYEHSENDLGQVLVERLRSVALDWHNYQTSPIGSRSDTRTSRSITCARQLSVGERGAAHCRTIRSG
ncbi:MAG TPA: hypothetical protein VF203_08230 [Burkholderiales bacterium]